jgi:hypothetical protein
MSTPPPEPIVLLRGLRVMLLKVWDFGRLLDGL